MVISRERRPRRPWSTVQSTMVSGKCQNRFGETFITLMLYGVDVWHFIFYKMCIVNLLSDL